MYAAVVVYTVHVQCMSHARFYLLDLLQILRKSIGLHSHVCVSVLFLSMHFSCYLLCFVHSRKAAAVWLFNNSRRQSPYKGKQSRSTPQQNKEATSKWKTTFYTNAGLNESPKGKNFRTILIICFIMFRHQFELVWFARKELTAWAIRYPYMWARNKAKIGLQCWLIFGSQSGLVVALVLTHSGPTVRPNCTLGSVTTRVTVIVACICRPSRKL